MRYIVVYTIRITHFLEIVIRRQTQIIHHNNSDSTLVVDLHIIPFSNKYIIHLVC